MKFRRTSVLIAAAALTTAGLAACGGGSSSGGGDSLTVGIKYDQPGLGLKEGSTYTGFDVDVAKYVADKLGYKEDQIEWKQAPSPQRETLLQSGQVDMIVATYSITDERKQKVDFAGPYFIAGQDLLVRSDDNAIKGPKDLEGKKLCSVKGSTSASHIHDQYPKVQLQEYDTYSKCAEALANGAVDALTTDNTILAGYAAQPQYKGKLKVAGNTFSEEVYGIGIKKGDKDKCTKINDALKSMVDDGSWDKFVKKNFGPANFKVDESKNPPKPGGNC
ncbi:MAG TPA: glutamate ABC transporter substrate-binding protein [Segeticoccus sp.]|uniref:glutamate ABC transporter substrate-binding protein n=1 Tax=Segeticoccus sp. TaxID=2706531 RepID=UPI002D7E8C44|nr:glutamate ABC transporter substrate-binding protein [Segeticoccus sp.]HET8601649.1 glutamate ABC transporter substrate-binding protein [Segeticoccus sp.]